MSNETLVMKYIDTKQSFHRKLENKQHLKNIMWLNNSIFPESKKEGSVWGSLVD